MVIEKYPLLTLEDREKNRMRAVINVGATYVIEEIGDFKITFDSFSWLENKGVWL
jgi:hypothetical protein